MNKFSIHSKSQSWYGQDIGIIILDAAYPCIPGNVGNANSYNFPVQYMEIQGASIDRLLNQADPDLVIPFIQGAQKLVAQGAKAITGACGFMALFQKEVSESVDVPVFLSSMLQIPFIHTITGKKVGIITANSACLTPKHFSACGISPDIPIAIAGMEGCDEFRSSILEEKGTLDSDLIEEEVVGIAKKLCADNPGMGSILLECSDLPPYAHAVQKAVGLPVYDFNTLINFVQSSISLKKYQQ